MDSPTGNETFDRIQQEIQEVLEREEELKNKYAQMRLNGEKNGIDSETVHANNINGDAHGTENKNIVKNQWKPLTNGNTNAVSNGSLSRKYTPNPLAKGVMHKFLKMRGKVSMVALKPERPPTTWMNDNLFEPAKVSVEKGKSIRNGFVSAEEKMRKELQEFQLREDELRKERRKSQPDLMAALEAEREIETNLKPTRSLAQMSNSNDSLEDNSASSSTYSSLKPSRSLAQLCDVEDEESLEIPTTHSLIMQFENLKNPQVRI